MRVMASRAYRSRRENSSLKASMRGSDLARTAVFRLRLRVMASSTTAVRCGGSSAKSSSPGSSTGRPPVRARCLRLPLRCGGAAGPPPAVSSRLPSRLPPPPSCSPSLFCSFSASFWSFSSCSLSSLLPSPSSSSSVAGSSASMHSGLRRPTVLRVRSFARSSSPSALRTLSLPTTAAATMEGAAVSESESTVVVASAARARRRRAARSSRSARYWPRLLLNIRMTRRT